MWSDTVQRSPENGRALIQLAWVMIRDEDLTSAAEYVNRAEKVTSPDAPTELLLAQALDRLGRDDAAEKHFTNAIARWPRYSAPMSRYAAWLFSHQRTAEAADWSRKAIQLNFLDNNARHTLMDVHSAVYEWPEVRRLATEAKTVDPEDGLADTALVTSQDAIDRVRRAEHVIPGEASTNDYLSLSVTYYRAKRFEDAIRASRQALQLQPDLAEAYANMAAAHRALGQNDDAANALREVIRLRPDFAFARTNLQILEDEKAGRIPAKK
jgi:Flp pilus assembly protein TadD